MKLALRSISILGILAVFAASTAIGQDATMPVEEIVARCAEALGGIEIVESLSTLNLVIQFSDHGGLSYYDIARPNQSRMSNLLVFDGKRAAWLERREGIRMLPPELVPESDWIDFEVDIAWLVPAYFDYPSVYLGMGTIDGKDVYLLEVNLPLGGVMTYSIDVETHLMIRARAVLTMGELNIDTERNYSDYREKDGLLYPYAFTYEGQYGVSLATVEEFAFNVVFDEDNFTIPASVDATD